VSLLADNGENHIAQEIAVITYATAPPAASTMEPKRFFSSIFRRIGKQLQWVIIDDRNTRRGASHHGDARSLSKIRATST